MNTSRRPRIALLVSFSGEGGVERLMLNLCEGLVGLGHPVDLLMIKRRSAYLERLPEGLNLVALGADHAYATLPAVIRYLRRQRPHALLAVKDRANQVAILAGRLSRVPTRIVVAIHTTVSATLAERGRLHRVSWYLPMRLFYPLADAVVAVSQGVARDLAAITGLPSQKVQVVPNPVVTPHLFRLAQEPIAHPWLHDPERPVIMGMGRLTRQKDFPTLLRAFAKVRAAKRCRLIILGEGGERPRLEALAGSLGISEDLHLPGFVLNPYPYLAGAALFVLSSVWEGFGVVLAEAMALGVPVVATDCPSGPREILRSGQIAPLVPMGDPEALAAAMLATLARPPAKATLQEAVAEYTVERSARRYVEVLTGSRGPLGP